MKGPIVFVTGVSCSGKTTVGQRLELGGHLVFDVDGEGTPRIGFMPWLDWRGQELLHRAVDHGGPVVITGITWPHKIIDGLALTNFRNLDLRFVMLDISETVLRRRLEARIGDAPHLDELVRFNLHTGRLLRRQVTYQRGGLILKASRMGRARVAEAITEELSL